ncbi:MAG: hypothetical protein H0U55_15010 [Rubrobacteraceae bacterium]|nr:hypothetical protein [Rubrobacteraceae bacterium]
MRRSVLLALSVALVVLVFAPIAAAQTNYQGAGNRGMNDGGMDDMGMDDNMMASPTAGASVTAMSSASTQASGSASTMASPSASASASASATTSATSSATSATSSELPDTGGVPLAPLLSAGALVFLASFGIFATRLMRRIP